MDAPEDDAVFDQRPHEPQAGQPRLIERNASYWGRYFQATLNEYAVPGVYDSRKCVLGRGRQPVGVGGLYTCSGSRWDR